jgi:hypothetical protein
MSSGEYPALMAGLIGGCALGLAGAFWPVVDQVVGAVIVTVAVAAGVALAVLVLRAVWGEIALHRECRCSVPVEREQVRLVRAPDEAAVEPRLLLICERCGDAWESPDAIWMAEHFQAFLDGCPSCGSRLHPVEIDELPASPRRAR